MRLENAGAAQLVQGFVRNSWRAAGPVGRLSFSGVNLMRLELSAMIAAVVGFWDEAAQDPE